MSVTIRYAPDNPVRVGEHHHTGLHGSRIVTFEHQRGGRVAKPVTHNYRDSENSYTTSGDTTVRRDNGRPTGARPSRWLSRKRVLALDPSIC